MCVPLSARPREAVHHAGNSKAHLLGLRQLELPASQEGERRDNGRGWGRRDTERRTMDPMTAASLGQRLAQRVTLTAGCDAVSGGTVDILCDCGLVT